MDASTRMALVLRVRERLAVVTDALVTVVCRGLAAKPWSKLTWYCMGTQLACGTAFSSAIASSVLER